MGHAPFSHLFEPLLSKALGKTHEDMSSWIIRDSELADVLARNSLDPKEVSRLAVGKLGDPGRRFLDQAISSTVDVDKMDFVVRDSYHTGAGYGHVDVFRLIYTMDLLDGNLAVDLTAITALEALLLGRLESFRAIYFHRVSRAVQIMLLKALELATEAMGILDMRSPEDYIKLDDYVVWWILKNCEGSRPIIEDIEKRRLLKCVYERTFFAKDEVITNVFTNEGVRRQMEEDIASLAKVDPSYVIIDVPSLPSVPYHYTLDVEPMDVPIFSRTWNGEKVPQKVAEISKVLEVMRAFMNITRVYTKEEHREKVAKAAESFLGKRQSHEQVSY